MITYNEQDRNVLYTKAISKWGKKAQILMVLEEMNELSFLLHKVLRNNKERYPDNWQIAEEIADVEIMLEQLKLIYDLESKKDFHEEVEDFKQRKLARLEERLK